MSAPNNRSAALGTLRATVEQIDWSAMTPGRRGVVEAFLRLATADGYAAVTMRRLAQQVNVKAPSLYSHFPEGKEDVVRLALRWHYSRWLSDVVDALDGIPDAPTFLRALIDHHVRGQLLMLENDMFDLMIASNRISGTLPEETSGEAERVLDMYRYLFEATLTDIGGTSDARRGSLALVALLDDVRAWSEWDGSDHDLARVCDEAYRLSTALVGLESRAVVA